MAEALIFFVQAQHFFVEASCHLDKTLADKKIVVTSGSEERLRILDFSPGLNLRRGLLLDRLRSKPNFQTLPFDEKAMRAFSEQLLTFFERYTPTVSSDYFGHFYLDMRGATSLLGQPLAIAHRLLTEVGEAFGLSLKVGIAKTKLTAYLAGIWTAVGTANWLWNDEKLYLEQMPLGLLPGLSRETKASMLREYKHRRLADLQAYSEGDLRLLWGEDGAKVAKYLKGQSESRLTAYQKEKVLEKEVGVGVHDEVFLKKTFDSLLVDLAATLRQERLLPCRYVLLVTFGDGKQVKLDKKFSKPTFYERALRAQLWPELNKLAERRVYIAKVALTLKDFHEPDFQMAFEVDLLKEERIAQAFDTVRNRFGKARLKLGYEL